MRLSFRSALVSFYLTSCLFTIIMGRDQIPFGRNSDWVEVYLLNFKDRRLRLYDSAIVYAWPSTGGRLELENPSALELDILGIENHLTESNRSTEATEEDSFALRLRRLGGTFYQYDSSFRRNELRDAEIHTWLGWPEDEEHKGGVWVLKLKKSEMYGPDENRMTGRIKLARTMQERCRAIEMCGGTFYAHPTDEHLVSLDPMPAF
jgi:hypothetical protein